MDRKTYPEADFNFIDVTAQADSNPVSTVVKAFSNMKLFYEDVRQPPYGTMELNQFVLDGSREIFQAEPPEDVPYWSDELSDDTCEYAVNPTLEINFSKAHSSIGLTLYFAEDIPAEINITWYTLLGTKLYDQTFFPDAKKYFCECQVENYGKIVIEFVKSTFPYRYAKLDHIQYGQMWRLGRDNIKTASILEELDPTSAKLSINTATVELVDAGSEFDTANSDGLWRSLQKEQPMKLLEYINSVPVDCGTFYLNEWSSQKNLVKFQFVDLLGLMDKTKFYGGEIYDSVPAGRIMDAIMASCGITRYSIEEEVYNIPLSGWLAIQTHRAALQQVVFACGAVADCSRSDEVKIYRPDRYVSQNIGLDRRFTGMKVTLDDYISAVSVSYNQYVLAAESKQISKSILPAGRTWVEFKEPYLQSSITVSVGNIAEARTNYVVVDMPVEGECIISGRKYENVENAYTAKVRTVASGENEKEKTFRGCTLMDMPQAKQTAEILLDYYQLRQLVEMRFINDGEGVGNWCDIMISGGGGVTTCITSQSLDLTGGNLAKVKCRGYYNTVTSDYFCGGELFAGEEGIV